MMLKTHIGILIKLEPIKDGYTALRLTEFNEEPFFMPESQVKSLINFKLANFIDIPESEKPAPEKQIKEQLPQKPEPKLEEKVKITEKPKQKKPNQNIQQTLF